jgi:hypothetical protein
MIDHGVNLLFPMEVAAGVDVNAWREKFPGLAAALRFHPREISRQLHPQV